MQKDVGSVSPEQSSTSANVSMWSRSATRVDAGTSIALSAQAREDFHEQTALEAVITFLRQYGRPRQMTFDRDPRLSLEGCQVGIFPLRCAGFCCAWASRPTSPRQKCLRGEIPQNLWAGVLTDPSAEHPSRSVQGDRSLSQNTTTMNAPERRRACGNVPPRVAFPTLPTLPALPERVDPDAWLATLDQKMYLRHVGRDGCVDIDLATYYIGPQMAGRAVLLQVIAENRQFAVWHQDQVVKLLPIKGLVGSEMALDEYVKYIQQEALAAPRRSSARGSRKVRQPSLWGEGA